MRFCKLITVILLSILSVTGLVFAGGQQDPGNPSVTAKAAVIVESETGSGGPDWLVENADDQITIIDSYGNQIAIEKPVDNLVATGMGQAFAALKSMNAEGLVVAASNYVTRNKAFFPVLSKIPTISKGEQSIDNELIIQLDPDFIITSPSVLPQFNEVLLSEFPVVQLAFNSTEAYTILGAILDKEAEAAEFVAWMESYSDVIDQRVGELSDDEYQKVFIYYGGEYGQSDPPPYGTFGKENLLRNQLIGRAGGRSLSVDLDGEWITVDPEWVLEQNPPVIIRECYILNDHPELGYGINRDSDAQVLMDSILNHQAAFEGCDAVKNKRVHMIYGDLVEDSWFISLIFMAKWLHPDLFEDLDPVKMHQEYITRFQRLDFDVTKQGLFTYSAK